jgi:two-component system, chemotaxis family, protein-glutamate methylesterase/glutaminase
MRAQSLPSRHFEALAIGASAGGIDALVHLLPALAPPGSRVSPPPAATFVVLHLPRDQPSLVVEVFRPRCARPVAEARDKEPVAPGRIYFAPPDYHLLLDDGPRLALSTDEPVAYCRPSIDVLFESAADIYGPGLAAVLLSGANHDGARGLATVQRAGGVTIVQDPREAASKAMPRAALAACRPDHVLPVAAIAALLAPVA